MEFYTLVTQFSCRSNRLEAHTGQKREDLLISGYGKKEEKMVFVQTLFQLI